MHEGVCVQFQSACHCEGFIVQYIQSLQLLCELSYFFHVLILKLCQCFGDVAESTRVGNAKTKSFSLNIFVGFDMSYLWLSCNLHQLLTRS